jgi:hypothetical protein
MARAVRLSNGFLTDVTDGFSATTQNSKLAKLTTHKTMMFGSTQPESTENNWRSLLDKFAKENKMELAALSWGLWSENQNHEVTVGIDLKPQPHFVFCPRDAVEKLNSKVDNRLQEMIGLINNFKPEVEVLMIGIGQEQVKLIYFESQPTPPECFAQLGKDVNTLLDELEARLSETLAVL